MCHSLPENQEGRAGPGRRIFQATPLLTKHNIFRNHQHPPNDAAEKVFLDSSPLGGASTSGENSLSNTNRPSSMPSPPASPPKHALTSHRYISEDRGTAQPRITSAPNPLACPSSGPTNDRTMMEERPLSNPERNAQQLHLNKPASTQAPKLVRNVPGPTMSLAKNLPRQRVQSAGCLTAAIGGCKRRRMQLPDQQYEIEDTQDGQGPRSTQLLESTSNPILRRSARKPIPSQSAAQKQAIGTTTHAMKRTRRS